MKRSKYTLFILFFLLTPLIVYGIASLSKVQNIDNYAKIQGIDKSNIRFLNQINVTEANVTAAFTPLATTSINVAGFGAGWNDVNVTALHSVPRGALVQISAGNGRNAASSFLGVRTDGSALARNLTLDQAEAGGYNFATFRTITHATTGVVELFDDGVDADYVYYITGYWEDVGFTERWTEFTATVDQTWGEHIVDASFSGRVASFLMVNDEATNNNMGTRHTSSSLARLVNVDHATGGDHVSLSESVKLDGDGKCDLYSADVDKTFFMLEGFFASNMDYTSQKVTWEVSGDGAWEDVNVSSVISGSPRVLEYIISHTDQADTLLMGARTNGSALDRRVEGHQSDNQKVGITIDVQTDANGIIEHYCEDGSEGYFYSIGYFIPSAETQTTQNTTLSAVALHTNGTQIYDGNGDPFRILAIDVTSDLWKQDGSNSNLESNPTDSPYEAWWNPGELASVTDLGFNTIDLNLIWVSRASNGDGTVNTGYFANNIDAWVEWNTDAGLYSIIGFQRLSRPKANTATYLGPGWLWADYSPRTTFVDIAETVVDFYDTTVASMDVERQYYIDMMVYCADRYKDNPYVMIAPSNEPMHGMEDAASDSGQQETATEGYRLFHEDMVDQMRSTGYTGIILIDRNYVKGGFPVGFATGNYKVRRDNVVWESHSYVSAGTTPADWEDNINAALTFATGTLGQPLYIGEWWIDPVAMKAVYDLENTTQNQWDHLETNEFSHMFHEWGRLYGHANYVATGDNVMSGAEIAIVESIIDRIP